MPGVSLKEAEASEIVWRIVEPSGIKFKNLSQRKITLPYFVISSADKADEVLQKLARLSDTLIFQMKRRACYG